MVVVLASLIIFNVGHMKLLQSKFHLQQIQKIPTAINMHILLEQYQTVNYTKLTRL